MSSVEFEPLVRTIELPDMVAYAGATWDWHRLHYDSAYLAERGLDRPVVDGQVFGAYLAIALREWFGPEAVVTALSFRFKSLVFAGETIRCVGTPTRLDAGIAEVDLRVEVVDDGRIAVAPASATLRLPLAPAGIGEP
jgi:acyl dehydratase